ncbi:MAG: ZIP family metal transporter [Flavobacteriaceae bacterium]|nr:MAG: ZIP family metal transporter [Flavobacteriaceae bacterium]
MTYFLLIIAVLLSFVFVIIAKPKRKEGLRLLLAFSGSFLLALTLFELLPSVYEQSDPKIIGIFIMLGILLQIFLEFFSKGAEHGHVHLNSDERNFPWLVFISLCIHSFLEGIPVNQNNDIIYGILVHKIPIALILSIFLVGSKISFISGTLFMVFFSVMTPLGSFAASKFDFISNYSAPITALVIGVFLHISTVILFESSEGHTFNIRKLTAIVLGTVIAYFL